MKPEMNAQDSRTLLIERIKTLEEKDTLDLVQQRIQDGDDPLQIIEDAQEGMRQVGTLYEERQYFISGLMMAGEIFREVMEIVEPILIKRLSGSEAGNILLGTVQGDIHDIGKNIFKTMLQCYGFTVTDLGVDVSPEQFVEQARSIRPHIIALSGLLTTSYDSMRSTVEQVRKSGTGAAFIIGGGLTNANVCAYVGAEYWAMDAMVGVDLCKKIMVEHNPSQTNSDV